MVGISCKKMALVNERKNKPSFKVEIILEELNENFPNLNVRNHLLEVCFHSEGKVFFHFRCDGNILKVFSRKRIKTNKCVLKDNKKGEKRGC